MIKGGLSRNIIEYYSFSKQISLIYLRYNFMAEDKTMIPDIKDSTKEERESYIKDRFKCISDCDSCGICAMYNNQDPFLVYKDYIDGVRDFQDITKDYR